MHNEENDEQDNVMSEIRAMKSEVTKKRAKHFSSNKESSNSGSDRFAGHYSVQLSLDVCFFPVFTLSHLQPFEIHVLL